jgi:hypothetical protein
LLACIDDLDMLDEVFDDHHVEVVFDNEKLVYLIV